MSRDVLRALRLVAGMSVIANPYCNGSQFRRKPSLAPIKSTQNL